MPERRAIGTAAAIQLAITPPAAAMFALMDSPSQCGANCLGMIYVPAVCAAGVTAVLAAPVGAWLAHALPVVAIRRIFACLLVVIAGNLALKSLPDSKRFREQAQAFWIARIASGRRAACRGLASADLAANAPLTLPRWRAQPRLFSTPLLRATSEAPLSPPYPTTNLPFKPRAV